MTHAAKILADSISPEGVRLTTFEVVIPRIVLAEFNTHRMFSRNSASSRAIPVKKMIKRVLENPYVPEKWGSNKRGMQAGEALTGHEAEEARAVWINASKEMISYVEGLLELGIHKQITNRLLEPWLWHTVIVTATEWSNFYNLRDNEMAHPAIQIPAHLMWEAKEESEPKKIQYGEWHLPLIDLDEDSQLLDMLGYDEEDDGSTDFAWNKLVKISCARCARVSYLTHDGKRDLEKDLELYDNLLQPGHMSPFEHAARPMTVLEVDAYTLLGDAEQTTAGDWEHGRGDEIPFYGNFRGWIQHRKEIPGEADILGSRRAAE